MAITRSRTAGGQTLVELALILPWVLLVLFGIIVLGIGVFYQQQVTNAAREAARYAAIHSATARCPTVSAWDPATPPRTYDRCDRPQDGWPFMTAAGRKYIFGMDPSAVLITACWSGYVIDGSGAPPDGIDAPPPGDYFVVPSAPAVHVDSTYAPCQINGRNAAADAGSLPCSSGLPRADTASAASEGQGTIVANQVTVYACTVWSPPLAGFLLIPESVTLRAVVTEPIERQQ
jgi:hypothetical protein